MGKQFKLRFSRVIPLFQSCRSKDPSNLPENPIPSYFRLSPVNPKAIDSQFPVITKIPISPSPLKTHQNHQQSSVRRQVSSAIVSVGCGCKSKSNDTHEATSTEFQWKKEEKWHVVAKIHDDDDNDNVLNPRRKIYASCDSEDGGLYSSSEFNPIEKKSNYKKQKNKKKKKKRQQRLSRISNSSAESGWFSSEGGGGGGGEENDEEEEETETLVSSSRTFSTDSLSEFGTPQLETIRESPPPPPSHTDSQPKKKHQKRVRSKLRRFGSKRKSGFGYGYGFGNVDEYGSPETETPARLSVFSRMVPACKVEGKVKESFAVVKKSEDPYMDFRRSMLEMIMEKQMFEAKDLEQLLHCFLSLNSKAHHPIIVEVFSEIWEFLFCTSSSSFTLHGKKKK